MAFPLHVSPRGLLELFRLRTLGGNPNAFSELVGLSVNALAFYGEPQNIENTATVGTAGPAAVGGLLNSFAFASTPHLVYAVTASAVTGAGSVAGDTLQLQVGLNFGNTTNVTGCVGSNSMAATGPGVFHSFGVLLPVPRVVGPGGFAWARLTTNRAGADFTVNTTLLAVPLPLAS